MPDSLTQKKYAVVTFVDENSVEVIPSIWLISKTETMWPNSSSSAMIFKFIKECTAPSSSWISQNIKINSFSDSFLKAKRKAAKALQTSHLSSDSSDNASQNKSRKRQKPVRYQSESSGSESESIVTNKRFCLPSMPKNDELGDSSSKHISNSRVQIFNDKNVLLKDDLPPAALYYRLFQYMEKMNKSIRDLSTKIDQLSSEIKNSASPNTALDLYFPDINLPVKSEEELQLLNDKLKSEKEFSANLVNFLFSSGHGKSERSFILSLTKKILSQDVATQFSRLGRKGKKSFQNYGETLNVLLAAASLKFKDVDREYLCDLFGKSLAGASEWNKRKIRPSDCSLSTLDLTNLKSTTVQ